MRAAPVERRRRLDPRVAAVVAEGLFSRLSFGVVGFALPLYARSLGLSLAEVGALLSVNSVAAIALKPALGFAADRIGARRTLVLAVALRSLVSLLLVFSTAAWQLFAIRALHGLSMALRDPAANVLLADPRGSGGVASAFAWYHSARTAAGSLSKALAGTLLGLAGARQPALFLVAFAFSSVPLAVVLAWVKEAPRGSRHAPLRAPADAARSPDRGPPERARASRAPLLAVAGLGCVVAASAETLTALFPVLATEYAGLGPAQLGAVYAASTAVAVLSGPAFGWLSDRVSRRLVLSVRGVANAASSVLYLAFPSAAGFGLGRCVDDLGKAAFRPAWGALMTEVAHLDRARRARTMSWLSMGEDAGGVLGPMLAGLVWSGWGIGALMAARALLAVAGEVYANAVAKRLAPGDA